jgi:hypothetical protein
MYRTLILVVNEKKVGFLFSRVGLGAGADRDASKFLHKFFLKASSISAEVFVGSGKARSRIKAKDGCKGVFLLLFVKI